jgi:hypothetical protein
VHETHTTAFQLDERPVGGDALDGAIDDGTDFEIRYVSSFRSCAGQALTRVRCDASGNYPIGWKVRQY